MSEDLIQHSSTETLLYFLGHIILQEKNPKGKPESMHQKFSMEVLKCVILSILIKISHSFKMRNKIQFQTILSMKMVHFLE